MLLLVLILVLIAFGLLVVALLSGSALWAWVSVAVSVVAAAVLLVDWLQRRSAVRSADRQQAAQASPPGWAGAAADPVTEQIPVVRPGAATPPEQVASADTVVVGPAERRPPVSPQQPPGAPPWLRPAREPASQSVTRPGVPSSTESPPTPVPPAAMDPAAAAGRVNGVTPPEPRMQAHPAPAVPVAEDDFEVDVEKTTEVKPVAAPAVDEAPAGTAGAEQPATAKSEAGTTGAPDAGSDQAGAAKADTEAPDAGQATTEAEQAGAAKETAPETDGGKDTAGAPAASAAATGADAAPGTTADDAKGSAESTAAGGAGDGATKATDGEPSAAAAAKQAPDESPPATGPKDDGVATGAAAAGAAAAAGPAPDKPDQSTGAPSSAAAPAAAPADAEQKPSIFEKPDTSNEQTVIFPVSTDSEPPEEPHDAANAAIVAELSDVVVVIDERPRYHVAGCRFLPGKTEIPLPVKEAVELGFTPCGWCNPDRSLSNKHRATSAR